jgi:helix-turn-helix protein
MSSQISMSQNVAIPQDSFCVNPPAEAPSGKSVHHDDARHTAERLDPRTARVKRKSEILPIASPVANHTGLVAGKMLTTREAAAILGRPRSTLERWRCEGRGPDYVKQEGGVRYHEVHLREYIRRNTRTSSVRALVETKREYL